VRLPLLAALWLSLCSASGGPPQAAVSAADPLTAEDDDLARHRDPALWRGLSLHRIGFRAERAAWRLWRIADRRHPRGPLWIVPHDNEDAAFDAALAAVRRYGGTLIAVDTGGTRMNAAVDYGPPVDPNRNFDTALPAYARHLLADLPPGMPIVALHTNARGFDTAASRCNTSDPPGSGAVSIRYCDDTLTPRPSRRRAWPWNDDDTLVFAAFRRDRSEAFCGREMVEADFNLVFERVITSDGSLSNYAVLHGLPYLNFETLAPGSDPADLAAARDRLLGGVDKALARCVPAPRRRKVSAAL
jgi:hypothetical protein